MPNNKFISQRNVVNHRPKRIPTYRLDFYTYNNFKNIFYFVVQSTLDEKNVQNLKQKKLFKRISLKERLFMGPLQVINIQVYTKNSTRVKFKKIIQ